MGAQWEAIRSQSPSCKRTWWSQPGAFHASPEVASVEQHLKPCLWGAGSQSSVSVPGFKPRLCHYLGGLPVWSWASDGLSRPPFLQHKSDSCGHAYSLPRLQKVEDLTRGKCSRDCLTCSSHSIQGARGHLPSGGQQGRGERDAVSQGPPGFHASYLIPSGKAPVSLSSLLGSHIVAIKGEDTQREVSLSKGCWGSACQLSFWKSVCGQGGEALPCSVSPRAWPPPTCRSRPGGCESLQAILGHSAPSNENTVNTGGLPSEPRGAAWAEKSIATLCGLQARTTTKGRMLPGPFSTDDGICLRTTQTGRHELSWEVVLLSSFFFFFLDQKKLGNQWQGGWGKGIAKELASLWSP